MKLLLLSSFYQLAYCYDNMDDIPGLTVNRYDSRDLQTPISPETPWTSEGENGPSFIMVFSEPTQINQLEFKTDSGQKVRVLVRVSTNPDAKTFDKDVTRGTPVEVESGKRLDIPSPPVVTGVYVIEITFITTDSQTVKVYGCTVQGEVIQETIYIYLLLLYLSFPITSHFATILKVHKFLKTADGDD